MEKTQLDDWIQTLDFKNSPETLLAESHPKLEEKFFALAQGISKKKFPADLNELAEKFSPFIEAGICHLVGKSNDRYALLWKENENYIINPQLQEELKGEGFLRFSLRIFNYLYAQLLTNDKLTVPLSAEGGENLEKFLKNKNFYSLIGALTSDHKMEHPPSAIQLAQLLEEILTLQINKKIKNLLYQAISKFILENNLTTEIDKQEPESVANIIFTAYTEMPLQISQFLILAEHLNVNLDKPDYFYSPENTMSHGLLLYYVQSYKEDPKSKIEQTLQSLKDIPKHIPVLFYAPDSLFLYGQPPQQEEWCLTPVSKEAMPTVSRKYQQATPLTLCSFNISEGEYQEIQDKKAHTPGQEFNKIFSEVKAGHFEQAKILLQAFKKFSPLLHVFMSGRFDQALELLKKGADPSEKEFFDQLIDRLRCPWLIWKEQIPKYLDLFPLWEKIFQSLILNKKYSQASKFLLTLTDLHASLFIDCPDATAEPIVYVHFFTNALSELKGVTSSDLLWTKIHLIKLLYHDKKWQEIKKYLLEFFKDKIKLTSSDSKQDLESTEKPLISPHELSYLGKLLPYGVDSTELQQYPKLLPIWSDVFQLLCEQKQWQEAEGFLSAMIEAKQIYKAKKPGKPNSYTEYPIILFKPNILSASIDLPLFFWDYKLALSGPDADKTLLSLLVKLEFPLAMVESLRQLASSRAMPRLSSTFQLSH